MHSIPVAVWPFLEMASPSALSTLHAAINSTTGRCELLPLCLASWLAALPDQQALLTLLQATPGCCKLKTWQRLPHTQCSRRCPLHCPLFSQKPAFCTITAHLAVGLNEASQQNSWHCCPQLPWAAAGRAAHTCSACRGRSLQKSRSAPSPTLCTAFCAAV